MEVFILQVFLYSILLLLVARILSGIEITNYGQALLAAFVLSVLNVLARPLLIVLTAPILVITLGLFLWVINAWLLMITSKIVDGFNTAATLENCALWHSQRILLREHGELLFIEKAIDQILIWHQKMKIFGQRFSVPRYTLQICIGIVEQHRTVAHQGTTDRQQCLNKIIW